MSLRPNSPPRAILGTPPSMLRNFRIAACLRQSDLAALAGIHTFLIGYFERGKQAPDKDQRRRIAKALHATPADVFPELEKPKPEDPPVADPPAEDPDAGRT